MMVDAWLNGCMHVHAQARTLIPSAYGCVYVSMHACMHVGVDVRMQACM